MESLGQLGMEFEANDIYNNDRYKNSDSGRESDDCRAPPEERDIMRFAVHCLVAVTRRNTYPVPDMG